MISSLSGPFQIAGKIVYVGASAGLALSPLHGTKADDLLSAAEVALYQAKADGKNCWRRFSPRLRQVALTKRKQQTALHQAFEQNEFEVFYQPQVAAISRRLIGAEALVRRRSPTQGLISPGAFLWAYENTRLAIDLGEWVLRAACAQAALWRQKAPGFRVGVNLFDEQLRAGDLLETVRTVLQEHRLPLQHWNLS